MKRSKYAVANRSWPKERKIRSTAAKKEVAEEYRFAGCGRGSRGLAVVAGLMLHRVAGGILLSSPVAGWGLKPSHLRLLFYTMHFSNSCGSRNGRLT